MKKLNFATIAVSVVAVCLVAVVAVLLTFPRSNAERQALKLGRQIIHDGLSAVTRSRSLLIDASCAAAVLRTETAA